MSDYSIDPSNMERVMESGDALTTGPGVKIADKPKSKDGDESVALAAVMGPSGEAWTSLLNDGCENPYPITSEALI